MKKSGRFKNVTIRPLPDPWRDVALPNHPKRPHVIEVEFDPIYQLNAKYDEEFSNKAEIDIQAQKVP